MATNQDLVQEAPIKTYGTLERIVSQHHFLWKLSDLPPHVAIRLKQVFPRISKTDTGPWFFPCDGQHAADLHWFTSRYPMEMEELAVEVLAKEKDEYQDQQNELEFILNHEYKPEQPAGLREGQALRDYQGQALQLIKHKGALLLGDEVGLGKTYSAIGASLLPGALPAIVVTEPHVQKQWKNKIEEFSTLTCHMVRTTKPYQLPRADIYLFRFSNIYGWVDYFQGMDFGLVAWDEIQSLRSGTSTKKGQASAVLYRRSTYKLGLTATPIYNYGAEIFEILKFIDPYALGSRGDFLREWTKYEGKLVDPVALGTYLRDQHVFLRRRRVDVGRELPPVNRIIDYIAFDTGAVEDIEDLARQLAIKATTGSFTERGQAVRELDILVRHQTGVGKAAMVADYVRIILEAGEPVLLLGWHRDVYDIWLKKLKDFQPAMYTGSETSSQKAESERRFLEGETDLMIMSLRSGAGLDSLQDRCKTCVFGELDWSPGIHHQVIGRLDRDRSDGEQNKVMAIFLVTDEGSDPPMMEVLGLKASEAHQVNDPTIGVQRIESDTTHLRKLVERYLGQNNSST